MKIRFPAEIAIGSAFLALGSALLKTVFLDGESAAMELPQQIGTAPSSALTVSATIGWICLFAGLLMLTPSKWFRWLEKSSVSQKC